MCDRQGNDGEAANDDDTNRLTINCNQLQVIFISGDELIIDYRYKGQTLVSADDKSEAVALLHKYSSCTTACSVRT